MADVTSPFQSIVRNYAAAERLPGGYRLVTRERSREFAGSICHELPNSLSEFNWICVEAGDSPEDFHLVGCSYLYRILLLSTDEVVQWHWSRLTKLKRRLGRVQHKHGEVCAEQLVSTHPSFITILDAIHKVGISWDRPPNAWAPMARNFGLGNTGSVMASLAQSGVGRDLIVQDLTSLAGSGLLKHPVVLTRLFGLAAELGGCWNPRTREITILGSTFKCEGTYVNPSIMMAKLHLGDVSGG